MPHGIFSNNCKCNSLLKIIHNNNNKNSNNNTSFILPARWAWLLVLRYSTTATTAPIVEYYASRNSSTEMATIMTCRENFVNGRGIPHSHFSMKLGTIQIETLIRRVVPIVLSSTKQVLLGVIDTQCSTNFRPWLSDSIFHSNFYSTKIEGKVESFSHLVE